MFIGIRAIKERYAQDPAGSFWWLGRVLGIEKYRYYRGKSAVIYGIAMIVIPILVIIFLFFGNQITNYFKSGYYDSSGIKHIYVKPFAVCNVTIKGAIAECPLGYECSKASSKDPNTGVCLKTSI